jgi:hypothetical protein
MMIIMTIQQTATMFRVGSCRVQTAVRMRDRADLTNGVGLNQGSRYTYEYIIIALQLTYYFHHSEH